MSKKINLLGCSLESLERFFSEIDESMFRAKQLMNWVHQKGVLDFNLMTNFNKNLREKLKDIAIIEPPKIIEEHISDEGTIKYLVEIESGSMVEMVVIPEKIEELCVFHHRQDVHFNALFVQLVLRDSTKILKVVKLLGSYGWQTLMLKIVSL